ncbi:MAG: hypothetical protein Ta2E_12400 [Mycoplasmoidaceae bacterium]|nr:MAG: hypothetical protein Ta2E_12400 [Mycoplasmoidaceae bacterium]
MSPPVRVANFRVLVERHYDLSKTTPITLKRQEEPLHTPLNLEEKDLLMNEELDNLPQRHSDGKYERHLSLKSEEGASKITISKKYGTEAKSTEENWNTIWKPNVEETTNKIFRACQKPIK